MRFLAAEREAGMKVSPSRTRPLAVLAALAVLALGACDSSSEESDYVDRLNEITEGLRGDVAEISDNSKAVGDPQLTADAYEKFAAEFGAAATEAAALDAPGQISELHDQIVRDLEAMESEAAKAAEAARASPAADLVHIQAKLEVDEGQLATNIDRTIAEINTQLQD
jgi:hypothetical protein